MRVDYRSRLQCQVQNSLIRGNKKVFINSEGSKELQPAVYHALNEISVTRGNAEFMVIFDIYVNEVYLTTVQGDGVLISTPTGSTAYNLSCGGSIVHSSAEVICVTPICPHSLSFRPVILPMNSKICIVLPEEARTDAWATFDGQTRVKLQRGEQLVINQSAFCVPFVSWASENKDLTWVKKLDKALKWNKQIVQKPLFNRKPPLEKL